MKNKNEIKIPSSLEIDTRNFLSFFKKCEKESQDQLNDIKIYSDIISQILALPVKKFNNEYFILLSDIIKICEENFKHLSKNRKD